MCRASTGFGWTVTAYTAVLSSAGMAQGFAGPARLIPDALRVATGKVNAVCVWGGGAVLHGQSQSHWCQMAEFRAAGPKNGPVKFLAA